MRGQGQDFKLPDVAAVGEVKLRRIRGSDSKYLRSKVPGRTPILPFGLSIAEPLFKSRPTLCITVA